MRKKTDAQKRLARRKLERARAALKALKSEARALERKLAAVARKVKRAELALVVATTAVSTRKARPKAPSSTRVAAARDVVASLAKQAARVDAAVMAAVLESPGGKGRHYLADVRERLSGVPRAEQDRALLDLQRRGRIVLLREDNTAALKPRDVSAALMLAGGNPRHLVYLQ